MDRPVAKYTYSSATTVAASWTAPGGGAKILSVEIAFSSAPTTSEDLTISVDAAAGATYDVDLRTVDPSVDSATSIVWEGPYYLAEDDAIDVDYANTDTNTVTVSVVYSVGMF